MLAVRRALRTVKEEETGRCKPNRGRAEWAGVNLVRRSFLASIH